MMITDLDLAQLRTLLAVIEEGTFAAAAEKVGCTQSAVTQQLQKLEITVGKPLFRANGRKRELTPAGWTLARYAHEILSISRHALSAVEETMSGEVLRVGVPRELTDAVMARVLRQFSQTWPDIRVILHVNRSPELMTMLEENRLEVAISTRHRAHLASEAVCTLQPVWLAASSFGWTPQNPLPLVLTDEPSLYRRITLEVLDRYSIPYFERFTSPSLSGLRPAILAGLGVTARPATSFSSELKELGEDNGLPPLPKVPYYGYMRRTPAREHVSDFLKILSIVSDTALQE